VLGAIARLPGEELSGKIISAEHAPPSVSEAYRTLRTNLRFASLDVPLTTLLITSASPGEGKSVTAANLAVVMAQSDRSVIIVDGDLRRPVQHMIFRVPNNEGLTSALLQGNPGTVSYLQATGIENLRVVTSGPLPPFSSELLGSQRMADLIEHLKSLADVIIFDSPPCLAVTDAAVLSTQVDGVLMVVNARGTRRGTAEQGLESLKKVGGNVVGAVLNHFSGRNGHDYQYYYSRADETESGRRQRGRSAQGWRDRIRFRRAPREH